MSVGRSLLERVRVLVYGKLVFPQLHSELSRLHRLGEMIGDLSARLAEADTVLAERLQQNAHAISSMDERVGQIEARESSFGTEIDRRIGTLEAASEAVGEFRSRVEASLTDLRKELSAVHQELAARADRLESAHTGMAEEQARLATAHTSLSEEQARLATAHASLSEEQGRLTAAHGDLAEERASTRDTIATQQATLEKLGEVGQLRGKTLNEATQELATITMRIEQLGQRLGETQAQLTDADTALAEKLVALGGRDS